MSKITQILAAVVLTLFGLVCAANAQEKKVKIGYLPWEDQHALALITKKYLEKNGYTVEMTEISEWGIAFAAASKGDVDVFPALPNYTTYDYWAKSKSRLEKVASVSFGLYQGVVVPSYMDIDSMDQLNSVADSVKGKIIGIEPGAGLMKDVANAIKTYELNYDIIDGSTAAMIAQLQAALERKEPIVTMLWTPSWMIEKFDVKYLKDPKNVFPPYQAYYILGRKGFSQENPEARELIASIFVDIEDITAMASAMNSGSTMEQAVDAWWEAHTDLIERWSGAAN